MLIHLLYVHRSIHWHIFDSLLITFCTTMADFAISLCIRKITGNFNWQQHAHQKPHNYMGIFWCTHHCRCSLSLAKLSLYSILNNWKMYECMQHIQMPDEMGLTLLKLKWHLIALLVIKFYYIILPLNSQSSRYNIQHICPVHWELQELAVLPQHCQM